MSLLEQRRARFEEWVARELLQGKNTAEQIKAMRDGDDYSSHNWYTAGVLSAAWRGCCAALDSIEIELPKTFHMEPGDGPGVYPMEDPGGDWISAEEVRAAIEAAGLKVKP